MSNEEIKADLERFRSDYVRLRESLGQVLVGQDEVLDLTLAALLGGGHVLLEGPPGVGKTLLGRTLAGLIDMDYRRIQFTSDLMPADIIGTYVVMESGGRRRFEFQHGPVFANLLLADEINRATPKTQAALFEALEERAVSVANERYPLPVPFFAIATQSLGDVEGTFPVPETQLDRFFFKLVMVQPEGEPLETILQRSTAAEDARLTPAIRGERLTEMMQIARRTVLAPELIRLTSRILLATHPQHASAPEPTRRFLLRGASPRGGQAMLLSAKVLAVVDGRQEVTADDVRRAALPALRHRLVLNFEGHAEEAGIDGILAAVLAAVK